MNTKQLKRLLPYYKPHRLDFGIAAVAMACDASISSASVWILKVVVDQIFIDKDMSMLVDLAWIMPSMFLLKGIFSFTLNYRVTKIGHAVAREIRDELMRKLLALDHRFHTMSKSSDLLARATNDVAAVSNMTSNAPLYVVRDGLTVIFLLGTILYLNARFASLIILSIPVFGLIFGIFIRKLRGITKQSQEMVSVLYGSIAEALHGLGTIKIYLYEKTWLNKFRGQNQDHYNAMLRFQRVTALSPALMESLSVLVMTAILFWGGSEVIHGTWSGGDFMAFIGAAFAVYMPIKHLAQVNPIIQLGSTSWTRICELLDIPLSMLSWNSLDEVTAPEFKRDIVFKNVQLTYPDGRTGVADISFTLRKGEHLGIAGQSGSGKSTLVAMLARFYDPTQGEILLDGRDIRSFAPEQARKLLGYVTQEAFLFDDTIAGNIKVGDPTAFREEIERAAKLANAAEFIEKLPMKYDTPVGERGVRLSGGQKQRIAIARAILKNPQILILDEATSNLDPESEELVLDALRSLLKDRTAIIISHRFQTLEGSDRILVLEAGRIVEETAAANLVKNGRLERLMGLGK